MCMSVRIQHDYTANQKTETFTCAYTLLPVKAGVCRPCVETELTATKKSATDGN